LYVRAEDLRGRDELRAREVEVCRRELERDVLRCNFGARLPAVEREVAPRAPRCVEVNAPVRAEHEGRVAFEQRQLPRDEPEALEGGLLERARVAFVQTLGRDVVVPRQLGSRPGRVELADLYL